RDADGILSSLAIGADRHVRERHVAPVCVDDSPVSTGRALGEDGHVRHSYRTEPRAHRNRVGGDDRRAGSCGAWALYGQVSDFIASSQNQRLVLAITARYDLGRKLSRSLDIDVARSED